MDARVKPAHDAELVGLMVRTKFGIIFSAIPRPKMSPFRN